ncbi:YusW family protein [Bacillus sp. DX1.1]|uniref:YusW family protein n=1 Tax=unclassified Bacillus (in: firmicutes) TaxID=185979 RepID=UPI00256FC56F|nr:MULTISPECIES: YusW family protein [unclassified Bacillus (in: firmicutes)]MDM5152996.1 YusW family protein [Bacillus sp. DX1.1]WJE81973.1 YusW family protein [Bacillus sp. DX3.1]
MRILLSILLTLMLVPTLTGCTTPKKEDTTSDKKTTEETKEEATQDLKLNFNEFKLDANYQDTKKDYEAEYKNKADEKTLEAKIEDHKANGQLTGDEAIAKLGPLLQKLKFDKDTPDQEVIDQVVDVFQLDKDYQKFDLEVVFSDGTKKEYKREIK